MPATVTLSPMISPVTALVMVTVVLLSAAAVIALVGPAHTAGRPVEQVVTPGEQAGIGLLTAVNVSVVGLYNSASCRATCPVGAPEPAAGVDSPRNELPLEPPTISTW